MKLRFRGDAVRIRLNTKEVRTLTEEGRIGSRTSFGPDSHLVYQVLAAGEIACATFAAGELTLSVPRAEVERWDSSETVTLQHVQEWDGGRLEVILEKDLACLTAHPGKFDPDAYANPLAGKVTCR